MIDTAPMTPRQPDGEMLPLLLRHQIQVLREAGHSQADVAERAGVSVAAVRRIEREAGVGCGSRPIVNAWIGAS